MNQNKSFQSLQRFVESNDQQLRFTSNHGGWGRIYIGKQFVEFRNNNQRADKLKSKASTAREHTHLGCALNELAKNFNLI